MLRKLNKFHQKKKQQNQSQSQTTVDEQYPLSVDLNQNEQQLRLLYNHCSDVIFRKFLFAQEKKALLVYIDGLSNVEEMDDNVLAPLMKTYMKPSENLSSVIKQVVSISEVEELKTFQDVVLKLSNGKPILLIDGFDKGVSLGLQKWEHRTIEEPISESVIQGPREGFVESIQVNFSLLRRRLRSPQFKIKTMQIGRYTTTDVAITYIEGLADQTLIEEVEQRLQRIDIDGIIESTYIEEFMEDNPFSPFPQVLNTERPDTAAANLLEGRVAILVDGSPIILIVPTTMYSLFQSPEDYYYRFMAANALRFLRWLFIIIALTLPSIYVALMTFHQEMIPTTLLFTMAAAREDIPFPALVEALMMEVTFEILREAGVRLPKQVGSAVSIVGALVIGEAAVSAGIVSAPMVIVVALTGITSFAIPRFKAGVSIRLLRFPLVILAGTLGLLGIVLGIIVIVTHLCSLRSFGVPYLSPLAPIQKRDIKDVLIRAPFWKLNTRPHLTGDYDPYRQSPGNKPGPTKGGD